MKKLLILTVLAFPLFLISCGLSANERAAINIELQNAQKNKQQLETNLTDTKAQLAVENDKMQQIKEYHWLRTDAERDEQIKNQAIRINAIQKEIQTIQVSINTVEMQISTFQSQLRG